MTAIALALAASLAWGAADFSGGLLARDLPVARVALLSQAAGFAALVAVVIAASAPLHGDALLLGAVAGLGGGSGLAAFYRALALGTMTIVAPIAACGAAVPLVLALAGGDRPAAAALAGALVALAGAVLASLEERAADERGRRDAVVLAAVAAVLLGVFSFFLGRASQHGGVLSALFGARVGSLTVLCVWALSARVPLAAGRRTAAVAAVGLVDLSANALYALAASKGVLAVVAVLGSLYPIPTVVLARAVLGERVSALQRAGVAIALVGVAVVAGAS